MSKKGSTDEKGKKKSIGSEVDQNYLKSFYPTPTINMKWVFAMFLNVQGLSVQAELTMEVIDIQGDNVKIKTVMGDQSFENTVDINSFAPLPSSGKSSGFRFETIESIKVPYGTFDTARIIVEGKQGKSSFLWLSEGLGPIKFGITENGIPATLELKEFIS